MAGGMQQALGRADSFEERLEECGILLPRESGLTDGGWMKIPGV